MRPFPGILLLVSLSLATPCLCRENRKIPLSYTREWIQLSRLWRQLSEHWAGKTFSRQKFEALGDDIQLGLPTLISLEAQGYYNREMRSSLEELFQRRYLFIRDQRYRPVGELTLVDLDHYAFISRSRMEDLLAALLWPPEVTGTSSNKIKEKARRDLALELEFLRRATALKELIAHHRSQAEKRQAEGFPVDWNQFILEAHRHIQALTDDYLAGRLKPGRETLRLHRLLLSLTEEPLPPER